MTFNEFQRELRRRNISDENAYIFTLVYERLGHVMKEHELMANAINQIASNMQSFVTMREDDRKAITNILRKLRSDGVEVMSVANEPEKH